MNKNSKSQKHKKKRCFNQFTLNDRIKIEIRYRDGWSLREIATELGVGRTAGSILREIDSRPRKGVGKYQAHIAHEKALNGSLRGFATVSSAKTFKKEHQRG